MRVIVVGAAGMLGADVVRLLRERGHQTRGVARQALDVSDPEAVDTAVREVDVVVNCAAWTAVDDAETAETAAFEVNATGAQLLARAARTVGAAIVHISTDYVFDGAARSPYAEDAPLAPRSAYGRTKAAGEWAVRAENPAHWILRTAWLYGAHGRCFPRTIAALAAERDELQVVADQIGQPTWTRDVAGLVATVLEHRPTPGIYHATSSGQASWFDLASAVVASAGSDARVLPTTSDAYPRPAPRPAWSVLGHDRWLQAGIAPIGDWRQRWDEAAALVLAP